MASNRIAAGTVVAFEFDLFRVSLSDKRETRSGSGVVVDSDDYSVWPVGYAVRVTESPNYAAGEVVHVAPHSIRKAARS